MPEKNNENRKHINFRKKESVDRQLHRRTRFLSLKVLTYLSTLNANAENLFYHLSYELPFLTTPL